MNTSPALRSAGGSDPGEMVMRGRARDADIQGWEKGIQPRGKTRFTELVFTEHRQSWYCVRHRTEQSTVDGEKDTSK